jgi:hypothetical protein
MTKPEITIKDVSWDNLGVIALLENWELLWNVVVMIFTFLLT